MKVRLDEEKCEGAGFCVKICPEIFELEGAAAVIRIAEDEDVPEELEEDCRKAAERCPGEAIILEE